MTSKKYTRDVISFARTENGITPLRSQRDDYGEQLMDRLGYQFITLDLLPLKREPERLKGLVNRLAETGIAHKGQQWFMCGIGNNTKGGQAYAYPAHVAKVIRETFPSLKDAIRWAPMHSPAHEDIFEIEDVRVLVVEDDNPDYHVGDGEGEFSREIARIVSANNLRERLRAKQARVWQGDDLILDKGQWVVNTLLHGKSIVFSKGQVKGHKENWPINSWFTVPKLTIAVLSHAQKQEMQVGGQVTQYWPRPIMAEYEKHWGEQVAHAKAMVARPMAELAKLEMDLRDNRGRVSHMGLLAYMAKVAKGIGRPDLFKSSGFVDDIANWLSTKFNRMCIGMPDTCTSLMGATNNSLPEGVVVVHPRDWALMSPVRGSELRNRGILMRNPHDGKVRKVKIVRSAWSRRRLSRVYTRGSIFMNTATPLPLGGDVDGDRYGLIGLERSWVKLWYDMVRDAQVEGDKRGETVGKMVSPTLGDKVVNMIGSIEGTDPISYINGISCALVAVWQKTGNKKALELFFGVILQQKAMVDTAKHDTLVDWKLIQEAKDFVWPPKVEGQEPRSALLDYGDLYFRKFANNTWRPFVKAEEDIVHGDNVLFHKGEVVQPAKVCTMATPLSRNYKLLGAQLPLVQLEQIDNSMFVNWLPKPDFASEGAKWAEKMWSRYTEQLKDVASTVVLGEDDFRESARSSALARYSEDVFECTLSVEDRREAALWQWWTSYKAAGTATCWRYGLVEDVIDLLMEHTDYIKESPKTTFGNIIGHSFTRLMEGAEQKTFHARKATFKGKNATRPAFIIEARETWVIDGECQLPDTDLLITVRRSPTPGMFAYTATVSEGASPAAPIEREAPRMTKEQVFALAKAQAEADSDEIYFWRDGASEDGGGDEAPSERPAYVARVNNLSSEAGTNAGG